MRPKSMTESVWAGPEGQAETVAPSAKAAKAGHPQAVRTNWAARAATVALAPSLQMVAMVAMAATPKIPARVAMVDLPVISLVHPANLAVPGKQRVAAKVPLRPGGTSLHAKRSSG
jgi:hypothetical protein